MTVNSKIAVAGLAACTVCAVAACAPMNPSANNQATSSSSTTGATGTMVQAPSTAAAQSAGGQTVQRRTGIALSAARGPLTGDLMIADRGNNRILIVTPKKRIVWSMSLPTGGEGANSRGADDAFFTPDGKHIIINEEDNNVVAIIDIRTKKIVWSYGHPGVAGSKPGYLNTPDDAYLLPNGVVTTADIRNQRVLFIGKNGHIIKQYGLTGVRYHNPPKSFAAPNGDTPLPDGGMMVTEIGGSYADRLDKNGRVVYTTHLRDLGYPSDTQLLPDGNLLVADYETPGRIEEVTPKGDVVWDYHVMSGPGELANPSLAIMLQNGDVACNDDYNHRVVVIDPTTNKIVWQYGHKGVKGTAPGYLNTPDGMDLVTANVQLPTS